MVEMFWNYWPHLLASLSMILGSVAAAHAAMTKQDVRAAIGWAGVIMLSPFIGTFLYLVAGINRIRHAALATRRSVRRGSRFDTGHKSIDMELIAHHCGRQFMPMKTLGDSVTRFALTSGNTITVLETGDEAYASICDAIDAARTSILLETYIFDRDRIGLRIADRLIAAVTRGVSVRVLIDSVGARYSVPSILGYLREGKVEVRTFNGKVITGLRLPYANLRTHRKIIIIDNVLAFTGGMNIREAFTTEFAGRGASQDTHFRVTGPAVADLHAVSSEDWHFASGEKMDPLAFATMQEVAEPTFMRVVSSGPDGSLETNHKMLMGAFSVAQKHIRIMSPYFLPDRELVSALVTAARRGVKVDIIVPASNNLHLVDLAMTAQFDQVLSNRCSIWRAAGAFNHSKLMTIDGQWSYVGTSNLDPRSLRLNFEVDLEVLDAGFAAEIEQRITRAMENSTEVTMAQLRRRPFPLRMLEKIIWLFSPYL